MTMINVTEAKKGAEIFGLKTGDTLFTTNETPCFYFATAPNGRELKISKRTKTLCTWGSKSTSPTFEVVEFEPADEDWKAIDDKMMAARR
jgi:hypothetical protein